MTDQTFPQPCTFATAGFKTVAVKYSGDPSNPSALTPTTFYRLAQIVPGARVVRPRGGHHAPARGAAEPVRRHDQEARQAQAPVHDRHRSGA